jgi:AraC-like DNA-binding protein
MRNISERSLIAAALLTGQFHDWESNKDTEFVDEAFEQWAEELADQAEVYEILDGDPIMQAIGDARTRRDDAERALKILIAYARTCDRPYSLREISERAKLSPSTVAEYFDEDREHLAKTIASEAKQLMRIYDRKSD